MYVTIKGRRTIQVPRANNNEIFIRFILNNQIVDTGWMFGHMVSLSYLITGSPSLGSEQ